MICDNGADSAPVQDSDDDFKQATPKEKKAKVDNLLSILAPIESHCAATDPQGQAEHRCGECKRSGSTHPSSTACLTKPADPAGKNKKKAIVISDDDDEPTPKPKM